MYIVGQLWSISDAKSNSKETNDSWRLNENSTELYYVENESRNKRLGFSNNIVFQQDLDSNISTSQNCTLWRKIEVGRGEKIKLFNDCYENSGKYLTKISSHSFDLRGMYV